jgi:hypothetical protein
MLTPAVLRQVEAGQAWWYGVERCLFTAVFLAILR